MALRSIGIGFTLIQLEFHYQLLYCGLIHILISSKSSELLLYFHQKEFSCVNGYTKLFWLLSPSCKFFVHDFMSLYLKRSYLFP
jgi:hypothetical protein